MPEKLRDNARIDRKEEKMGDKDVRCMVYRRSKSLFLVILSFISLFVVSAEAGILYGQVNGAGFQGGDSFVVMDGERTVKRVTTDRDRRYRFFIAPGSYEVRYPDANNPRGSAWIQSTNRTASKDIYLK
jgi:hypothetical protein